MAIRMRYGLEAEFNPSKMVVGEWAVSTDSRFVRMCFAPGVVLRMATYEAFEADMAKIKAILEECKDIQTAITRIQSEVNAKAVLCAEYVESAKESADAAAESAEQAKMYAENASAVTKVQIATKDIAGLVKGGENHIAEDGTLVLTDRTDSGLLQPSHAGGIRLHSISAVEDRQDGTTGAQLFDASAEYYANKGVSISVESKGKIIKVSGIQARAKIIYTLEPADFAGKTLTLSGKISNSVSGVSVFAGFVIITSEGTKYTTLTVGEFNSVECTIPETTTGLTLEFTPNDTSSDLSATNTMTIEDFMMSSNGVTIWEPYTGGKPSPAPGEPVVTSANQLKLNGTTQTVNGVTATFDMANQFVVFVGDPTADAEFIVGTAKLETGTWYANAICQPTELNAVFEYSVSDASGNVLMKVEAQTDDVNVSDTFTLTEAQTVTFKFKLPSGEAIDQEFLFAIVADANTDWDEYTVEYTEGYPQKIEGTVMKNLITPTATSQNVKGVDYTVNGDKSIRVKGTATENSFFVVGSAELKKGLGYTLNKSASNVKLSLRSADLNMVYASADNEYADFAPSEDMTAWVVLRVESGTTVDTTVYPMVRPYAMKDGTYVPPGCMRVVGKGKNLLKNIGTTTTINGVKFTFNDDGSVSANGTATADAIFYPSLNKHTYIKGETYILSGCPSGGSSNKYLIDTYGDSIAYKMDTGYGATITATKSASNNTVRIIVKSGVTVSNLTFNPMIRLASVADDTYTPYVEQSTILSKPFSTFHNIGGEGDKVTAEAEVRRFATVVFDGSSDEGWNKHGDSMGFYIDITALGFSLAKTSPSLISHFRYTSQELNSSENLTGFVRNKYAQFRHDEITTVKEWRAYLSAHPIEVTYELATEQVTPLPTADQIALHSLKSYDGVTHLYTDTYPQMVIDAEWGTSKVGAVAFDGYNAGRRAEIRAEANYNELAAALLALNQE